jgi:hypothetical protein
MKQQTPVEWFFEQLTEVNFGCINKTFLQNNNSLAGCKLRELFKTAKKLEQKHLRDNLERLVQEIKDYTCESRNILGLDDREPSEIVDIFLEKTKQKG